MHPDCLPFTSLPHQTQLFLDFLHHFGKVERFYAPSPFSGPPAAHLQSHPLPAERRESVAAILERQNRSLGAGTKALENIQRLREGASAVVTGQQVGLLGGPMYALLKAVTATVLAEKSGAVPIFWLATEDHDLAEVSSVHLPATDHLETFSVAPPHKEGAPVGAIAFDEQIAALFAGLKETFGDSDSFELLKRCYAPGSTFGAAFGRLIAELFRETGLVLIDPSDVELHRIARPVFDAALRQWREIDDSVMARNQELEESGYHAQVKVTPSHTLCFYVDEGVRYPLRHDGSAFVADDLKFNQEELLRAVENAPEKFSANVLLRPIMQDYLLPTLCYIGGPAEIAYFAQVEPVYRKLLGRVTPVVSRFSATLIEPRQAKLLERYQMRLADVFCAPEKLREHIAAKVLPDSIMKSFDAADDHVELALKLIQGPLDALDPTLLAAAENAGSKMRHQLQSLRDKAARAELRKNSDMQRQADELSTMLYPNKNLQEREIGAAYFLLKHGTGIVSRLQELLRPGCHDHQVIFL
ncbi:MAG TPA: bacillithiol biosynthesis cysteine-adding enzyme BshC [Candidatus Angelobacter sp.]|nr:bacillithiol biosynthesis cysteine-adding enzyme BshC [Candidatus Angelobacter sp.]